MKVDIMKAYDNVRWEFVIDTLRAMGFPPIFMKWIFACMTSPSFSICINGSLHGYFKADRGLRQGDPRSPYLFVLVMEVLSRILQEKSTLPNFKFHWRCEKAKIVNLCFADDLMISCKGDVYSVNTIKEGLEELKVLSGLSPSPSKSHIFFSSCEKKLRDEITELSNSLRVFSLLDILGAIKSKLNVSWPNLPWGVLVNHTAKSVKGKVAFTWAQSLPRYRVMAISHQLKEHASDAWKMAKGSQRAGTTCKGITVCGLSVERNIEMLLGKSFEAAKLEHMLDDVMDARLQSCANSCDVSQRRKFVSLNSAVLAPYLFVDMDVE
ncbi:uncharacterized protein LOC114267989 [Camellia sinensis]|uniref:uncharacterized protein LOC114267989 n=1 Tax=Camellia sinensis TaxID=4442 RepID=UPI001035EB75|nr:uncharacterized protein LOC114267989 [Camellia sinensis]